MNQFLLHWCVKVSNKKKTLFYTEKIYPNFKHIKYYPQQIIENVSCFVTGKILNLYCTSFLHIFVCSSLVLVGTFWRTLCFIVKCFSFSIKTIYCWNASQISISKLFCSEITFRFKNKGKEIAIALKMKVMWKHPQAL